MDDSMLLGVAIVVFVMLLIGLGLTIAEFRYGQPRREGEQTKTKREAVAERHEQLSG
jgi:hypothetical protein